MSARALCPANQAARATPERRERVVNDSRTSFKNIPPRENILEARSLPARRHPAFVPVVPACAPESAPSRPRDIPRDNLCELPGKIRLVPLPAVHLMHAQSVRRAFSPEPAPAPAPVRDRAPFVFRSRRRVFEGISGGYGREPSQSIAVRVEFTFERVEVSLAALLVRSLSLREGLDGVERGPEPVEGGAEVPRGGVRGGAPRGELRAMLARGVVRGGEGRRRGNGGRVRTGATRRGRGRGV